MVYSNPIKLGKPGSHSEFMQLHPDAEAPYGGRDGGSYRAALSEGEEGIAAAIAQEVNMFRMCADLKGVAVCNRLAKQIARRTVSSIAHPVFMGACGFPGDVA